MNPLTLNRVTIIRLFWLTAGFLILANFAAQYMRHFAGHGYVYGLVPLFDLDEETNLPSFFSAFLLLVGAVLLWIIATFKHNSGAPFASKWVILAWAFFYLAVDEAAGLHELLIRPTQEVLGPRIKGVTFVAAWVIPALIILVPFAVSFRRFLLHLPRKVSSLILLAACLYVAGAIGVEIVGLRYVGRQAVDLTYSMFVTLEESLEMAGVIVFIHAVLVYIEANYPELRFRIGRDPSCSGPEVDRRRRSGFATRTSQASRANQNGGKS